MTGSLLPARFIRLTGPKNKLLRHFELLRTDRRERESHGHVIVQGLKTIQELALKGHQIRTIGITFDEHNLPIRQPALSVVDHWKKGTTSRSHNNNSNSNININMAARNMNSQGGEEEEGGGGRGKEKERGGLHKSVLTPAPSFQASQFVAVSRAMTTRILGTDSKPSEHEVWAEVQIPNHKAMFSVATDSPLATDRPTDAIHVQQRMLLLDQISDPGNMGLMVRAGMAMGWDGLWTTPGTVDLYNDKVVRASRAHCLEWPSHVGGWVELAKFLEKKKMNLVVADMLPPELKKHGGGDDDAGLVQAADNRIIMVDHNRLVWWNWPANLSRHCLPERIAMMMSSEHHGVRGLVVQREGEEGGGGDDDDTPEEKRDGNMRRDEKMARKKNNTAWTEEQKAKAFLLKTAIRVSIPMHPAVESMNVATAATVMMWELGKKQEMPQILAHPRAIRH
ncbi:hypothetical protein BG004_007805 [Podila humilis]|nr:hypothetical protein BG004_007805 [Podila humilis]